MVVVVVILLFIFSSIYKSFSYTLGGSAIENILETQIIPRSPKEYRVHDPIDLLRVRPDIFRSYNYTENNQTKIQVVPNWEVYAMRYWYETRSFNMSCPQIPTGIATYCDWALMVPCLYGNVNVSPRSIFIHTLMLPHFKESTLNFLPNKTWKFILLSGGHDLTIPYGNLEERFKNKLRGFGLNGNYFDEIINNPQVIHWFAENRDREHPKFGSLPGGVVSYSPDYLNITQPMISLRQRPLKFFCADRIRDGAQFQERYEIKKKCEKSPICLQPNSPEIIGVAKYHREISHLDFLNEMASLPFIICPHGGGIDPSPKAFEAIFVGTIPIIKRSSLLLDSYGHLPVAFVDDWDELLNSPPDDVEALLKRWILELEPYYEPNSELRKRTLHKLSNEYWISRMLSKLNPNADDNKNMTASFVQYIASLGKVAYENEILGFTHSKYTVPVSVSVPVPTNNRNTTTSISRRQLRGHDEKQINN